MKITRMFCVLAVCLGVLTSASFAADHPLNQPLGLAVDASGNLYVANHNANNILIYNSSYVQQTSETITSGIDVPTGLAIDASGNLWVANYGASNGGSEGSITEYAAGVMQSSNTITNGVVGPQNMVFDELGDLWVNNNGGSLTAYVTAGTFGPPATLQQTIPISDFWAVGEGVGVLFIGTSTGNCQYSTTQFLFSGAGTCFFLGDAATAFARDNTGGVFVQTTTPGFNVVYFFPNSPDAFTFESSLPFTPAFNESGMAVDNIHHRLYVSNRAGNKILVYGLASSNYGKLIHTIR
jgi:hypothetical protein